MRISRLLATCLCALVLAGTILAVCCLHDKASPADRLCHSVFAGAIVLSGMALGLAMECVSESRSAAARCSCCTKRQPPASG